MKRFCIAILWFVAGAGFLFADGDAAAPGGETAWTRVKSAVALQGQVALLYDVQGIAESSLNPGNDFYKLESRSAELHFRPNFSMRHDSLRLGLSPRLVTTYMDYTEGLLAGDHESETDVFINEGYLKWTGGPLMLVLERKNLQWGNSFLTSPSNPFNTDTGKSRPDKELPGSDFVSSSWFANDWLTLTALVNFGKGENQVEGSRERFHETYALKCEMVGSRFNFSPVLSFKEDDRFRAGAYGSGTISDSMLVYVDVSLAEGSEGRYPVASEDSPYGVEFQQSKDDSSHIYGEALVGGSYTFLSGTTVYLEYFHYGQGCDDREADLYYSVLNDSADSFLTAGGSGALFEFAEEQLYDAYQSHLAFLRRNYMTVYAVHNDLLKVLDVTLGVVVNLDDSSYYGYGLLVCDIGTKVQLASSTILYSNGRDVEYPSTLDYLQTFGIRYFF